MSNHGDQIRVKLAELAAADEENRHTTGERPRGAQVLEQELASYAGWFQGAVDSAFLAESFDALNDAQTALAVAYLDEQIAEVRACTARQERWDDEAEYGGLSDFLAVHERQIDPAELPEPITARVAELRAAVEDNRMRLGVAPANGSDGVTFLLWAIPDYFDRDAWADLPRGEIAVVLAFLDRITADVRRCTGEGINVSEEPEGAACAAITFWDNALIVLDDLRNGREPAGENERTPVSEPRDGISFIE